MPLAAANILSSEVGKSCALLTSQYAAVSDEKSALRHSRPEVSVFRCDVVIREAKLTLCVAL